MAQFGAGVNPQLGAIDYSAYSQGAAQGSAAIGKGLASLGEHIGQGVREYYKKKEEKELSAQADSVVSKFIKENPEAAASMGIKPDAAGVYDPALIKNIAKMFGGPGEAIKTITSVDQSLKTQKQKLAEEKSIAVGIAALNAGRTANPLEAVQITGNVVTPGVVNFFANLENVNSESAERRAQAAERARKGKLPLVDPAGVPGTEEWARIQASNRAIEAGARAVSAETRDVAKDNIAAADKAKANMEAKAKQQQAINSSLASIDSTMGTIKEAFELSSAGAGGPIEGTSTVAWAKNIAGLSKHKSLNNLVETIKASLSINNLKKMRSESPTGGAMSNVSDKDIELLGSDIANLDATLPEVEFRKRLMKVHTSLVGMRQALSVELPSGWTIKK